MRMKSVRIFLFSITCMRVKSTRIAAKQILPRCVLYLCATKISAERQILDLVSAGRNHIEGFVISNFN
jgi:hypothetical protein